MICQSSIKAVVFDENFFERDSKLVNLLCLSANIWVLSMFLF